MIQELNEQMVLSYELPLQNSNETLIDLLQLGARLHVTINTHSVRGIGKTYFLIEYAKKFNCVVVEPNKNIAMLLRKEYNFDKIYGQEDMYLRKMQICIVDDGVNINKLLKDMECNIVTGFYNPVINKAYENKTELKDFNENVVSFLKREEDMLQKKADKMLSEHDFPMYTKIINAYQTVVELIKKYDWQFKYSEYNAEVSNNVFQREIAIWEQNGDGQIRNHKMWKIEECKSNGCN